MRNQFLCLFFRLGVFLESPTEFTVDARSVTGSGAGRVECLLTSPSGRVVRCPVKNLADGTYQVQYAPNEPGKSFPIPHGRAHPPLPS